MGRCCLDNGRCEYNLLYRASMCKHDFSHFVLLFLFQDKKLKQLISAKKKGQKKGSAATIDEKDWQKIATNFGSEPQGRDANQCRERYSFLLASQIGKGPWSAEEDKKIISMVSLYGM